MDDLNLAEFQNDGRFSNPQGAGLRQLEEVFARVVEQNSELIKKLENLDGYTLQLIIYDQFRKAQPTSNGQVESISEPYPAFDLIFDSSEFLPPSMSYPWYSGLTPWLHIPESGEPRAGINISTLVADHGGQPELVYPSEDLEEVERLADLYHDMFLGHSQGSTLFRQAPDTHFAPYGVSNRIEVVPASFLPTVLQALRYEVIKHGNILNPQTQP